MNMNTFLTIIHYAGSLGAFFATIALIFARGRPPRWARGLAVFGLATFGLTAGRIALNMPGGTFDFSAFCESGREVLHGRDPIDLMRTSALPPLNPPTAFPLFAVFALGPIPWTFAAWVLASSLMAIALIPLAWHVLTADPLGANDVFPTSASAMSNDALVGIPTVAPSNIPSSGLLILTAVIALSNATRACLSSGQVSIATAFAIFAALAARSKRQGWLAGTWLSASTIKIGTMVPFLLLFGRKSDLKSWAALLVVTAGLCLTTGRPLETPGRVGRWLQGIARMSEPGRVNDFTYQAPDNGDMIGLDHAFYRAGVKTRTAAKIAQFVVMTLVGGFVAWQVLGRSEVSEGTKQSFVVLFAMLFLYHRLADTVILALPLLHATNRARGTSGRTRLLFAGSALGLLPILFMQRALMKSLRDFAERGGVVARIIEAGVLPYACWCLLASIAFLWLAERTLIVRPARLTHES